MPRNFVNHIPPYVLSSEPGGRPQTGVTMMRSIGLLSIIVAFTSGTALTGTALAAPGDTYTVANAATLRSGPGGSFPEVGTISVRTGGQLTEISRQGGWVETDRGWVWGALICPTAQPAGSAANGSAAPACGIGWTPGSGDAGISGGGSSGGRSRMVVGVYAANLRQAPRADAPMVFPLGQGVEVTMSGTQGDWARVSLGDVSGWVLRSSLQEPEAKPEEATRSSQPKSAAGKLAPSGATPGEAPPSSVKLVGY